MEGIIRHLKFRVINSVASLVRTFREQKSIVKMETLGFLSTHIHTPINCTVSLLGVLAPNSVHILTEVTLTSIKKGQ